MKWKKHIKITSDGGPFNSAIHCYIHLMKMKKINDKNYKHLAELVTTPVRAREPNSSVQNNQPLCSTEHSVWKFVI